MHHIDRTLQEMEMGSAMNGAYENDYEHGANDEFGQAFEQAFSQAANYENDETFELEQDPELEMAYQLLEVSNEYELNQFLGGLMSKAFGAAKSAATNFVNSPAGKSVGQYLSDFGQKTLPQLGSKVGALAGKGANLGFKLMARQTGVDLSSPVRVQGAEAYGGVLGQKAGNMIASPAERIFGLEPKKLGSKNQELEIARSFVRFATDLTRQANQAIRQNPSISAGELGRRAITASAKQYAPGLLPTAQRSVLGTMNGNANGANGSWVRRGSAIVLHGV
jgi:hypothetical protein